MTDMDNSFAFGGRQHARESMPRTDTIYLPAVLTHLGPVAAVSRHLRSSVPQYWATQSSFLETPCPCVNRTIDPVFVEHLTGKVLIKNGPVRMRSSENFDKRSGVFENETR